MYNNTETPSGLRNSMQLHISAAGRRCHNRWLVSSCSSVWPLTSRDWPTVTAGWHEQVRQVKHGSFPCLRRRAHVLQCSKSSPFNPANTLHYWHSSHSSSENPTSCIWRLLTVSVRKPPNTLRFPAIPDETQSACRTQHDAHPASETNITSQGTFSSIFQTFCDFWTLLWKLFIHVWWNYNKETKTSQKRS